MIPAYPLFAPIETGHKKSFNEALKKDPPEISEFTFTNLYSWRETYDIRLSDKDGLIIVSSEKDNKRSFFKPVGNGDLKGAIGKILEDSGAFFMRLPEKIKTLFDNEACFNIEYDRDNSDYIYKVKDLIELKGRKYDGKRNLIKKFKSSHDYEYVKLDASNADECLEFEEAWCTIKNCDSVEGLSNERRAVKEMVMHFSDFNLIGGAIKIDDRIRAVSLAEELNPETLVMHILKADPNIPGLYQTLHNEFLVREADGFEYLNMEQDLGVGGLRKAKLSYHPAGMVQKYTLTFSGR